MYDSFDNMYQATIGIDFLSKASAQPSLGRDVAAVREQRREGKRGENKTGNIPADQQATIDNVPGRPNGTVTALGHCGPGKVQESNPLVHPRLQRRGRGLRYIK